MAAASGKASTVTFGSDISGYYTDFSFKSTEAEQERIDISSKNSYVGGRREFDSGLRGEVKTNATVKVLYEAGGGSPIEGLALGDEDDLVIAPDTGGTWTLADSVVSDISMDGTFNGKLAYTVTFYGFTEAAWAATP